MEKHLNNTQIFQLASQFGYEFRAVKAIIQVESDQHGFHPITGKIIIQFEPSWFKRHKKDWLKDTKNVLWQSNKVGNQTEEWKAFNNAFASDPNAAMKSTSIGMMQVMGFHYATLGFKTVGAMWDFAKESEYNQVLLALRWIKSQPALDRALKAKDWARVAYFYNGELYEKYNYDGRLLSAYRLTEEYKPLKVA